MSQFLIFLLAFATFLLGACLFTLACIADCAAARGRLRGLFVTDLSAISIPVVLLGGALALLCGYRFGFNADAATRLTFLAVLAAVTMIDFHTMEIPNTACVLCAALGLISCLTIGELAWQSRVIGALCVSVPLTLLTMAIPGAFGGGDIKLMAACGIFLGWQQTLLAAFVGIVLGGIWGAAVLLTKKRKGSEHFAFGPCLCAGMALCTLFGDAALRAFLFLFDWSRFLT